MYHTLFASILYICNVSPFFSFIRSNWFLYPTHIWLSSLLPSINVISWGTSKDCSSCYMKDILGYQRILEIYILAYNFGFYVTDVLCFISHRYIDNIHYHVTIRYFNLYKPQGFCLLFPFHWEKIIIRTDSYIFIQNLTLLISR